MNKLIQFLLILLSVSTLKVQTITGKIIDKENNKAIEYASIGIVNTTLGTISNEKGDFEFTYKCKLENPIVRVSMIAYKPQTFQLKDLLINDNLIKLEKDIIKIAEVNVRPKGETIKIGTTNYTKIGNWCGWGGSYFGKGWEIGNKIDLGENPVHLKSIHIHVYRQAFDTSFFRLDIRSINNSLPSNELLTQNIIIPITNESGWFEFDLRNYNLNLTGNIAVSLEWLKISGIYKDRAMKINQKEQNSYVLFNTKKNKGCTFTRWGTEAQWKLHMDGSSRIFLTVNK